MARLLGLVAGTPVDLYFSMKEAPKHFQARGENNPDGWGLGWFNGGVPEVRKHALPASGEIPEEEAAAEARSELFVAHVRRSSRTPRAVANTHPFAAGGWLFAHTGALYPLLETKVRRQVGRISYEGHTDSEAFFRLLLHNMETQPDPVEAILAAVRLAVEDGQFSGLNFVLARAGTLYAFRYATRSAPYYSLLWLRREAGRPLEATSRDNFALVRSNLLADTRSVLVCSEELGGPAAEPWKPLDMGELLVVHGGPELTTETIRLV
jgi:predicted glutamine amidotransferase